MTKHTHQMVFGKREPGCPRCAELAAGAEPRRGWGVNAMGRTKKQQEAANLSEIDAHFAGERHRSGACGPVCTFGEW